MYPTREVTQSNIPSSIESSGIASTPRSSIQSTRSDLIYPRRGDLTANRDALDSSITRDKPTLTRDSDVTVGFSDLPNQIHRKTIKKGFEFTFMIVGMMNII